ncbi:hypothetical protein JQ615_38615 [Bradyrhizobium jicamae]|uniref:Uncharacterized protein n=1 Tax=Bradyrhizobium jicamae TaxID=280332 RepID=A0ABS5FWZ6_9BRAD|nr:hypothetical protein [Bradyrhizobium jicamae]MBR0801278.1 hypothetical protein [Bradyrhizobium jicamae]
MLEENHHCRFQPSVKAAGFGDKATPAYTAGLKYAIEQGWLEPVHESGTSVRMV